MFHNFSPLVPLAPNVARFDRSGPLGLGYHRVGTIVVGLAMHDVFWVVPHV